MLPRSQTGPWVQGTDSGCVSSGGMTCRVAAVGWQSSVVASPLPGTALQCSCEPAEAPGRRVTAAGAGGETRTWGVGRTAPEASTRPAPPYPVIVQVRPPVLVSTSGACRGPAPESPGRRLPVRSPVWQRPVPPGVAPEVVDPAGAWPVAVEDAPPVGGEVLVEEPAVPVADRGCEDDEPSAETEPSKEHPASATSSSAGSSRRAEDMITRPTLETRCDREPVCVCPFRDTGCRDGHRTGRAQERRPMQPLPHRYDVEIAGLLASPEHRFDGRPGTTVPDQAPDRRDRLEIRAGLGIVGDRYYGRPAHRDAAVTVLAAEAVEALAAGLGREPPDPLLARRNVALRGAEV